ncbi:protein FAM200A-like [Corticium candelabrum]|uniref:protein FAM200A-like n=1 Tax=Corticium candelabrum TaxID=121492 RepID=UPI002E256E74|nr:protein FAM200A-like [Corticium candelabrum]
MVNIHDYIMKEIHDDVNSSLFWPAMADETTDSSVTEQLILYVRFVNIAKKCVQTRFLADSENIFDLIKAIFEKFELPRESLVGYSSDGASVMTGVRKGVAAKLKAQYNPKLFTQHCFNHRLVLASKDAQKEIPGEVETTIKDVLDHLKWHSSDLCACS